MDESDLSVHEGDIGSSPNALLARIRLWTRPVPSQQPEPPAVDEAAATPRIVDMASIAARCVGVSRNVLVDHSFVSCSSTRNAGPQINHFTSTNGHSTRDPVRFSDRSERTRALLARYGFDPQEAEWTRPKEKPVQRVQKSIRMRIRFWCHHCSTQYGSSKTCPQCAHQRCNRCVRHPPRRTTPRARLADAALTNNALSTGTLHTVLTGEPDPNPAPPMSQQSTTATTPQAHANRGHESIPRRERLSISPDESRQGDDALAEHLDPNYSRIRRRHRVRVLHRCHVCMKTLAPRKTACSVCGHQLCKDCPRDPSERHYRGAGPSNSTSGHTRSSVGSESDDGGDEYENDTTHLEAPKHEMQSETATDAITLQLPTSTRVEDVSSQDRPVALAEPPPPI